MGLKKFVNSLNNEMFVPKVESCNCEEPEVEYVDPTSYQEATDTSTRSITLLCFFN